MIDYAAILSRKYAGSEWILNGDEYSGLIWSSDTPKPTKATLDGLWETVQAEIKAEADAKEAARLSRYAKLLALGLTEDELNA